MLFKKASSKFLPWLSVCLQEGSNQFSLLSVLENTVPFLYHLEHCVLNIIIILSLLMVKLPPLANEERETWAYTAAGKIKLRELREWILTLISCPGQGVEKCKIQLCLSFSSGIVNARVCLFYPLTKLKFCERGVLLWRVNQTCWALCLIPGHESLTNMFQPNVFS